MKPHCAILVFTLLCSVSAFSQENSERIRSSITTEENGDIIVTHEVTINAPVDQVWKAYTTSEGWQSWVAPVAEVNLQMGGTIQTNYRADGKIGDADSVKLRIINYVPERILTLQAELGENFPKVLKEREKLMSNVITFQPMGDTRTKLMSYGLGYKDSPELKKMLQFFVKANQLSYRALLDYVEKGQANPHQAKKVD